MTTVKNQVLHKIRHKLSSTFVYVTPPKSPVPHLLTSNATPTEDEKKTILETISEYETRIVTIEVEMHQEMDFTLKNLKKVAKQVEVYNEFIRAHRALLVPIRNLPPELLQEIFLLYAETSTGYHRWIRPPFLLGQICKSWRQAAIALPPLWNQLPVFKLSPRTRNTSYWRFLEELIRRSGTGDTLRVYIRAPFKEIFTPHPVIVTLARHADRIRTMTIESGIATVRQVGDVMKGKLLNLRELELSFWTKAMHEVGSPAGEITCFSDLPKLRKVVVMGRCPPTLSLPWAQIEEYKEKYDGGTLNDCLAFAGTSGTLQSLQVVKNAHHTLPMVPPLTLQGIKDLKVRLDDTSDNTWRFFTNLTLPSIESIQVVFGGNPIPSLTSMLGHSKRSHSLRRLALRGSTIHTVTQLASLFSCIPQLAELDLEVTDGDPDFLRIFTDPKRRPVLPYLETLSLYTKTVEGMDGVFNDIAKLRCEKTVTDIMPEPWAPLSPPTTVATPSGDTTTILAVPPVDFDLIQEPRPLLTFRLNLPTRSLMHAAQRTLNKWHGPTSTKQFRDAGKMDMWRRELIDAYPEFFTDLGMGAGASESTVSAKAMKRGKVPKFPKRWNGLLNEIEGMDPLGFDRVSLRSSNLHHTLGLIANAPSRFSLNSKNAEYIKTAKYILGGWRLVFRHHLSEYRWAIKGGYSLVYVTEKDSIRENEDATEQLVYGMKDNLTSADVFWPRNL